MDKASIAQWESTRLKIWGSEVQILLLAVRSVSNFLYLLLLTSRKYITKPTSYLVLDNNVFNYNLKNSQISYVNPLSPFHRCNLGYYWVEDELFVYDQIYDHSCNINGGHYSNYVFVDPILLNYYSNKDYLGRVFKRVWNKNINNKSFLIKAMFARNILDKKRNIVIDLFGYSRKESFYLRNRVNKKRKAIYRKLKGRPRRKWNLKRRYFRMKLRTIRRVIRKKQIRIKVRMSRLINSYNILNKVKRITNSHSMLYVNTVHQLNNNQFLIYKRTKVLSKIFKKTCKKKIRLPRRFTIAKGRRSYTLANLVKNIIIKQNCIKDLVYSSKSIILNNTKSNRVWKSFREQLFEFHLPTKYVDRTQLMRFLLTEFNENTKLLSLSFIIKKLIFETYISSINLLYKNFNPRLTKFVNSKHLPLYLSEKKLLIREVFFFSILKLQNNLNISLGLSSLGNFMKQISYFYTGFETTWRFINIHPTTALRRYKTTLRRFKKVRQLRFLRMSKQFKNDLITQLVLLKDPQLLIIALQRLFFDNPIKRHRRIFFKIRYFFQIWYVLCRKRKTVRGYSIYLKGKLGKKGSVRKRKIYVKNGLVSFTNKDLRVNSKNFMLWTDTGCIGANISIFF